MEEVGIVKLQASNIGIDVVVSISAENQAEKYQLKALIETLKNCKANYVDLTINDLDGGVCLILNKLEDGWHE